MQRRDYFGIPFNSMSYLVTWRHGRKGGRSLPDSAEWGDVLEIASSTARRWGYRPRLPGNHPARLPTCVHWGGFLADSVIWGSATLLLLAGPTLLRRVNRGERGECLDCGYDLAGNVSGVCPESGRPAGMASPD